MEDAISKGAKALTGGKKPDMPGELAKGNFYEPTILGDATIDMKVRTASPQRLGDGRSWICRLQWRCSPPDAGCSGDAQGVPLLQCCGALVQLSDSSL